MNITLTHRDGTKKTWNVKADNIYNAIIEIIKITQKEDDTGYFFEPEDASAEYLKEDAVIVIEGYGIDLRNISV